MSQHPEMYQAIIHRIFNHSKEDFNSLALEIFAYQYNNNPLYRAFAQLLAKTPARVTSVQEIPFLPVAFFKAHKVITSHYSHDDVSMIFASSGTTSDVRSKHHITDAEVYKTSLLLAFQRFFGPVNDFNLFALLPSYMERGDSSLVYMMKTLIEASGSSAGGFFLDDYSLLEKQLIQSLQSERKTMLLGVSFALLDFGQWLQQPLPGLKVVETGGMKGRQREMVREELHAHLQRDFGIGNIHSEYGMTELCSQAWSTANGLYYPPPWMKVMIRDLYDPFTWLPCGKAGGVNILDLANINSCAFISTSDIGRMHADGSFEILGRADGSEPRGCNLMIY